MICKTKSESGNLNMADYKKIIRSSQFIFLVGNERTRLSIHAGIVQAISNPLRALIDNGHMTESIAGFATLDDVEEETFIGFCEYAYTGAYLTPELSIGQDSEITSDSGLVKSTKESNGVSVEQREEPAIEDAELDRTPDLDDWSLSSAKKSKKSQKKKSAFYYHEIEEKQPEESPGQITIIYPYEQLWERFRLRKFDSGPASFSPNPNILFHAKLYVFATKYLIEPLRQQCLRSLHRDLSSFSLNRKNRSLIFDLLDFTYAHTGRFEANGRSTLRDIVIHYVACEIRTLADDEKLTELLDSDAEIGSDLVMKLVT
ncbi:hypothetical protein TSTA_102080 [Talaromyces stipitatus ATCC 10500]|uniref:BTB domain-containing protein n=1 Tax=Talaromyces stipitatus (strain ATCC 10500 / CBS 375.48 / QM 6759 / NRRL 1006) TaxID=441959 RepID=B8MN29_TALSN|nr:uncharacterized protein TSTA_102080 [Talaromyces stipitatus ATCC 10500]EED13978.1 hypothetical protein TSTA_102080 [Talaromyces stipitatus ATCC 10500]